MDKRRAHRKATERRGTQQEKKERIRPIYVAEEELCSPSKGGRLKTGRDD